MFKTNNLVKLASKLAKKYHKGQKDKAGVDYFKHLKTVADNVASDEAKQVAYLHDIIEDTHCLPATLRDKFSKEVFEAIMCITRGTESYDTYLVKVAMNKLAYEVKIADMTHNSNAFRFKDPSLQRVINCEKYKKHIEQLKQLRANYIKTVGDY